MLLTDPYKVYEIKETHLENVQQTRKKTFIWDVFIEMLI